MNNSRKGLTTLILDAGKGRDLHASIARAAKIIRNGGIVVFPTETVYGIGANALNAAACRKIYRIKGRKSDNPLIVHVSSIRMAETVAVIPSKYLEPLKRIWPAPLTVIVKAKKTVPKVVTGGLDTVAIRMPDSNVALSLIRASGVPIAAPSANISKKPSSTNASHAKSYFYGSVDAIMDAGQSKFGVESTVMDLGSFTLLRPGAYTVEQIEKAFGMKVKITKGAGGLIKSSGKPISPGMKYRHYSPDKPLLLFTGRISELPSIISGVKLKFTFIGSAESCRIMKGIAAGTINLGRREDTKTVASRMFGALIDLDSKDSDFGIIEEFDEKGIGLAVMNRIRKACSNKYFAGKKELDRILRVQGLGN